MGEVCAVRDGGRCVTVSARSGESFEFELSPASAKFVLAGSAHGADMELIDAPQGA